MSVALRRFAQALLAAPRALTSPFLLRYPAGHFYSPIPSLREIRRDEQRIFRADVGEVAGVDLRQSEQLALLGELAPAMAEFPFPEDPSDGWRYWWRNGFFGRADGAILFALLRHAPPRRVVEVGSGFSSALMLDANERYLERSVRFTFIDPHPARLLGLLRGDDDVRSAVLPARVQDVPADTFASLDAGDVLFVDSSHVSKIGSDVNHLLFEVLPRLRPGVLVHVHDVPWPFEYARHLVYDRVAWNEAYLVRAFLQFNAAFDVLLFNSFLAARAPDALGAAFAPAVAEPGVSLWLRRAAVGRPTR
jgi:predicted O-methyltransferase YrrM